jgi:hypothetical protein
MKCHHIKFFRTWKMNWLRLVWNHWLNPLGNWHEPLACPQKRVKQYRNTVPQWLPEDVWWGLYRNPLHNLTHFWLGITPRGKRYVWIDPECNGWTRVQGPERTKLISIDKDGVHDILEVGWQINWWSKPRRIPLPIIKWVGKHWEGYFGWMSRGNLGAAFRRR